MCCFDVVLITDSFSTMTLKAELENVSLLIAPRIEFGIRVLLTQPNNPTGRWKNFRRGALGRLTYVLANIESPLLAEWSRRDAKEDRVPFRCFLRGDEFGKALLPPGGARLATNQLPTLRLSCLDSFVCPARRLITRWFRNVYSCHSHRACCTAKYP